jgi:hypothetical protein
LGHVGTGSRGGCDLNALDRQNEIIKLLSNFVAEVKGSAASGHQDINKTSEGFLRDLFREVFGLSNLKDLNEEKPNFPGLDLGDDAAGVAFQATSEHKVEKIQETLKTVIRHQLHERFPKIKVYILTERQNSYSQPAIDRICGSELKFDTDKDVLDYRDILKECSTFSPLRKERVLNVLREHLKWQNLELRDSRKEIESSLVHIPQSWCHETTNDETYVRRSGKTEQLIE